MKILVLNGPNLNMLGVREPGIYGTMKYSELEKLIFNYADGKDVEIEILQSNYEGELITKIQQARGVFDGIVINPGALTHYSYAILDALLAAEVQTVEVHLSDIQKREEFRRISVTSAGCEKQICGLGAQGYFLAIDFLINNFKDGSFKK